MSIETTVTNPTPLLSEFRTTTRNELHSWMAHTVIYAAYFSVCFFIFKEFEKSDLLNVFTLVAVSFPVIVQLLTWNHWNMGFKSRVHSFFVSVLVLFCYLKIKGEQVLNIFWIVTFINLIFFLLRRLIVRKRHSIDMVAVWLTVLIVSSAYSNLIIFQHRFIWQGQILILQSVFMVVVICIFSVVPLLQVVNITRKIVRLEPFDRSQKISLAVKKTTIYCVYYFLACFVIVKSDISYFPSVAALSILLLSAGPGLFISRQKTHFANLVKILGFNNLNLSLSLDPSSSDFTKLRLDSFKRFLDQNRQYGSVLLILLIGGILIPYLALKYKLVDKDVNIFYVGATTTFGISLIYITFWFIKNRKKHIVFPFLVAEGQSEPQLQSLANLMTYAFIQQLRYLALLLSMKQVENIASRNDNTLPIFVTSGQEMELIEQVRSLGEVEVANAKIPLGGILSMIGNSLAHTKVHGTLVRQKDNSIAILAEFVQRGGQVVAVDIDFVPETSATDLDEKIINNIAKSLAVKLIVKLGNHPHIASTWVSMLNFVNGLDAAYHKNWWQSVSFYRNSIHLEESVNGPTGVAYYHLGASLVSQGNIKDGYSYLKVAEAKNAPQAEIQYMLALTQFYMFHDFLHVERDVFEDIKWRCVTALNNRPYFPEAHHLLGTVYYQRGKLLERSFTKTPPEEDVYYSQIEVLPQDYLVDYKNAVRHLTKAIRGYDKVLRMLPGDIVARSTDIDERTKLIQYRMSATHRLGDALRSMERYSEGDHYYQETLYTYPVNIRTLIDRAKTFCFSGNWQKADEFIRINIFNNEENRSNKSVNFYMGWALAGGLVDKFLPSSLLSDRIVKFYEKFSIKRRVDQRLVKSINALQDGDIERKSNIDWLIFGKSMLYLDYAIHQYPRYIHRWRQTNWHDDFKQAALKLYKFPDNTPESLKSLIYLKPLNASEDNFVGQIYFWLCWRVASMLPKDDKKIDASTRFELGWKSLKEAADYVPNKHFYKLFRCLLECKDRYERLLEEADKVGVLCNLESRHSKLRLGKAMFVQWQRASKLIEKEILSTAMSDQPSITFSDRWAIDVFSEFSMLICHILTEAEAYEYVEEIADRSTAILKFWIDYWGKTKGKNFFFSPKVLDYQISSIISWNGYSKYMKIRDYATQSRRKHFEDDVFSESNLKQAKFCVDEAVKYMAQNPLAIYVNALLLKDMGHKAKAADELNRLLTQTAPFDPHVYTRKNSHIENFELFNRKVSKRQSENSHKYLVYGERSCGDLQFSNVMSFSQIHMQLAEIAEELEDYKTSVGHMTLAFAETIYHDEQAEILLRIVETYNRQGLYAGALAVLEDAKLLRKYLSPVRLPSARSLQVLVLECVLKTNMENYRDSLDRGLEISRSWSDEAFSQGHNYIIDYFEKKASLDNSFVTECIAFYKNNILDLFLEIEDYANEKGIVKEKKKLLQLIRSLQENTVLEILSHVSKKGRKQGIGKVEVVKGGSINFRVVMASQILTAMYRDIVIFVVQQCEWMNNCAFNYCELDLSLKEAEEYSKVAIELMEKIKDVVEALNVTDWSARLAQFYDTLGWIYYRKGRKIELQTAYEKISNNALKHEQESPLIYYHLARVRLAQIERIWQGEVKASKSQPVLQDNNLLQISKFLSEAFLYWRHAHRLDKEKNLYIRLRIVRLRIDQYRENWERIMLPYEWNKNDGKIAKTRQLR